VRGDNALGLGADVYKDAVSIGADDHTFDYFAAPQFRVSGGFFFEEGGHGLFFHGDPSLSVFRCQELYLRSRWA
jgi:hypothetical protein